MLRGRFGDVLSGLIASLRCGTKAEEKMADARRDAVKAISRSRFVSHYCLKCVNSPKISLLCLDNARIRPPLHCKHIFIFCFDILANKKQ